MLASSDNTAGRRVPPALACQDRATRQIPSMHDRSEPKSARCVWISVKSLLVKMGGKLPLPDVSRAIGKRDEARLPLLPAKRRQVNGAIHVIALPVRLLDRLHSSDFATHAGAKEPHDTPPQSRWPVGCRRCRCFDTERSDRRLSD